LPFSTDAFHVLALKTFIGRFQFHGDPLDIAIRKLLMEVGLPRETQQIDRVIEAFAYRYSECNPKLLGSNG
jgi:Sec7-like guanine-nucleotide exchange factor